MDTFFAELDTLEDVYRSQLTSEAAWRSLIGEHLRVIDALLPTYASIAETERLATAQRLHANILENLSSGVIPSLQEVAIDAAILEKALSDALTPVSGRKT